MARCSKCTRQWTAPSQAHCTVCHEHFSSVSAADLHLRPHDDGERVEHLDPAVIVKRRTGEPLLKLDQDRFGAIWRRSGDRPEMTWDGTQEAKTGAETVWGDQMTTPTLPIASTADLGGTS
jgi:hypothetical protein